MRRLAFALACYAVGGWLIWETVHLDMALPFVRDYRTSELFDPGQVSAIEPHKVTGFCPCEICCGRWSDGVTASGSIATAGRTVAVDPSLWPIGTCLEVPGLGRRIAEDTGSAIQWRSVDVFFESHREALEFGVRFLDVGEC